MKLSKYPDFSTLVTSVFVFIAVSTATYDYYLNSSLWRDTAALALNILDRSYIDLTTGLDYDAVAPILFLFIEKFFISLFSDPDYGLHFFPFLCFLASIPLVHKVTNFLTQNPETANASVCLFCVSPMLSTYSVEVKQYMVEVFVLLALLYFTQQLKRNFNKRLVLFCIAGVTAIFLSFTSVIVLLSVGIYLFAFYRYNPAAMIKILVVTMIWLFAFILLYLFVVHPTLGNKFLFSYWAGQYGYLPFSVPDFWIYPYFVLKNISTITANTPFHHWSWKLFSVFYLGGISLLLYQRKFAALFFLLFPLIIHLLISSLKLYPVSPRTMLYQAPLYIITISSVFSFLNNLLRKVVRKPFILFLPALLLFLFDNPFSFPEKDIGMKNNLKYIQSTIKEGDTIYVYHPAVLSLRYYEKTGYIDVAANIIHGSETLDHGSQTPQQLVSVDGRLWVIFSELNWENENEVHEMKFLIDYLNTRGVMLDRHNTEASGDRVYLFEL
jgi:hypothetical protein